MESKTYFAQRSGWILDGERRKGQKISATPEEAKFAVMQGTLAETPPRTVEEQHEATRKANLTEADQAAEAAAVTAAEEKALEKRSAAKKKD